MGSNAKRRTLAALDEPTYDIEQVPAAKKDLRESEICRIRNRQLWLKNLPECLNVCNEAERRFDKGGHRRAPGTGGKPLSLEYLADRIDTDDPLYGYTVRTKKEGWLQGFATVTTFTEWQRFFQWDSLAEKAHVLQAKCKDSLTSEANRLRQNWHDQRVVDRSGELSRELSEQVHRGSPEDEGVIWPHLAEVSLLGGLGCGRALLTTVIDELEQSSNIYTHVVLQAAENSVPFYEKMGFVRVGAVAKYGGITAVGGPAADGDPVGPADVMNEHDWHSVVSDDETPSTIAAHHGVEVFDVVFLNNPEFHGLGEHTVFATGAEVRVPRAKTTRGCIGWHTVWPDSQTVAEIAMITGSDIAEVIRLNRDSFPGLRTHKVLAPGSKVQLPPEKAEVDKLKGAVAYRHWTFANDKVDSTEESYMMARRLEKDDGQQLAGEDSAKEKRTVKACRNGTAEEMATGNEDEVEQCGLSTPAVRRPALVDTIIELIPKPSAWAQLGSNSQPDREFYYVLTHVQDLDWCHGVRVLPREMFSKGANVGKPRWTLAKPEEQVKELDAPAARCMRVKRFVETTRKAGNLLQRVYHIEMAAEGPAQPTGQTAMELDPGGTTSSSCAVDAAVTDPESGVYSLAPWLAGGNKRRRGDVQQAVETAVQAQSQLPKRVKAGSADGSDWLSAAPTLGSNGTPPRDPSSKSSGGSAGGGAKRGPGGLKSLSTLNRLDVRQAVPKPTGKKLAQSQFKNAKTLIGEDGERLTACGNKPKRPWLPAEDELLRSLVNQHGPKSWSLIAKEMATRKGKQCRERWINHLDPRVRKGTFSSEEHKLIEEAVATIGHKWIEIAALLPGRTDNAIKNYWNSLLRHAQRSAKRKAMGKPLSGSTAKRSVAASRPLPPSLINSAGMPLTANGGLQKCDIRGEINLVKTVRLVGAV